MSNPVIFVAATTLALVQAAPSMPPAPPAPPPIRTGSTPQPVQRLLQWLPGPVTCAGIPVEGAPIRRPLNTLRYGDSAPPPVALRFAIAADGRPVSIDRASTAPAFVPDDLLPAFAASRFPAGERRGCTVTYQARVSPLGDAPVEELVSYTISPRSGRLPREGWARIRQPGTCADLPRPAALLRAMPDFPRLRGTPGVPDWSLVAYDTDAAGKPVRARVTMGTGNRALDEAAVAAIRASRFSGGARTGCVYPYWRGPATLPAPPLPEGISAPGPGCAERRDWQTPPTMRFVEPYRRRRIEGWAVLRYDVAPWGEIGNVTVVAAQPTAEFGAAATNMLRTARMQPSERGLTGCTDRIRFVMAPEDAPPDDPDEAAREY